MSANGHDGDAPVDFDSLEVRLEELRRSVVGPGRDAAGSWSGARPATPEATVEAEEDPLFLDFASEAPAIAARPPVPSATGRRPPVTDLVLLGVVWVGFLGLIIGLAAS